MLTRPEIIAKQLITITVEPGTHAYLRLKNKNLVYEKDGEIVNQCSLTRVLHLLIIGDTSLTTNLIRELNDQGVSVCLLKPNLKPYAYFGFETQANFILRAQQYALTEDANLHIAQAIMSDKIHNQAVLLRRLGYEEPFIVQCEKAARFAEDRQALLGLEGSAGKLCFKQYYAAYGWSGRSPRVKPDPINFMLDIGYTVLFNFVDGIARHFGLDTYKGVYHQQFFARRSLVCDLMEPFRCLIDNRTRTAMSLGMVTSDMFKYGKYGVYTEWKNSSKLTKLYAEAVMEQRVAIFLYVQDFYKHMMDRDNPLPTFRLKR
jgi:CRISPR-associated protein Cas1